MTKDLKFKIKKVDIKNKVILLEIPFRFEGEKFKDDEIDIKAELIF